jgi:hypothetical protein
MSTATTTCFGLALAISAFALAAVPALAVEAPAISATVKGSLTKVEDRDHDRCERVRKECRERHHDHEGEFGECVRRKHCEL